MSEEARLDVPVDSYLDCSNKLVHVQFKEAALADAAADQELVHVE